MSMLILCSVELSMKKCYSPGAWFYYSLPQILVSPITPVRTVGPVKPKTTNLILNVTVQRATEEESARRVRFYFTFTIYL